MVSCAGGDSFTGKYVIAILVHSHVRGPMARAICLTLVPSWDLHLPLSAAPFDGAWLCFEPKAVDAQQSFCELPSSPFSTPALPHPVRTRHDSCAAGFFVPKFHLRT